MSRMRMAPLFLLIAALALFAGCSMSGDTATVTINTGLHQQAAIQKISVFDRILAYLSFSTKAQADPPSSDILPYVDFLKLSITGPGMSAMQDIDIPNSTGKITLEVPAGSSRVFTIVAFDDDGLGNITRSYGGISTVDLTPGDSVNLNINMGQLPEPPDYFNPTSGSPSGVLLRWRYSDIPEPADLIGFIVYRSHDNILPYIPIAEGRKEDFFVISEYQYLDLEGIHGSSVYDYYKIRATNPYGEGDLGYAFYWNC